MVKYIPEFAERLLDVGCNTGTFGRHLKSLRQIEIWGIEPDYVASIEASRSLDHVINGYFDEQTAIPSNYFDVVIFNDSLEHIPDPWSILRLAKDKLKPDGLLVLSIPNLLNKNNLLHILIERDFRYERDGIRDKTHLRFFTMKSISRTVEECGFKLIHIEGINEDWYSSSILNRIAYRLFRSFLMETRYRQIAVTALPN